MSEDFLQIVLEQADRVFGENVTKEELSSSDRGEWPANLWKSVEEAGLLLAMVAEAQAGVGLAWKDASALIRRMGYWALPLPLAETMIANWLWCMPAEKRSKARWHSDPSCIRIALRWTSDRKAWCCRARCIMCPGCRTCGISSCWRPATTESIGFACCRHNKLLRWGAAGTWLASHARMFASMV